MTEANQKKLYDHYVATGQKERVDMLLKAYPHFDPAIEKPVMEKPVTKSTSKK